ncbi:hypothetical protein H5T88_08135 [bacterium]|nr:hypothetical protein [bacterium]
MAERYPRFSLFLRKKLNGPEISSVFILVIEAILRKFEIRKFSEEGLSETIKDFRDFSPLKTDPNCPVCSSPNRFQYERYYISCNKDLEWVLSVAYALNEHHLTLKDFKIHFQKHFNPQVDISRASQDVLKKIGEREGADFVENVLSHFSFTNELLEKLEERIKEAIEKKAEIPSKEADLLKSLLLTLLRYAKWLGDFKGKEEKEVSNLEEIFLP